MQWNDSANAGFTTGKPWLPVAPKYKTHNVATETKDPDSILNLYRKIIALRSSEKALREGKYIELNGSDPNVLAFARQDVAGETVIVALNMSDSGQSVKLELGKVAAPSARAAHRRGDLPPLHPDSRLRPRLRGSGSCHSAAASEFSPR